MSFFDDIPIAQPVQIFHLRERYLEDPCEEKVLLSIGGYRTEDGDPYVMPAVKYADRIINMDETLKNEYSTPLGMESFSNAAVRLLLGNTSQAVIKSKYMGVQSYSSIGGLRIGAEFLVRYMRKETFYISDPSYENYERIFRCAGFKTMKTFRYLDTKNLKLDFKGMMEDLREADDDSVIVLQVCGHNPTGFDPDQIQWDELASLFATKRIFPFFDCGYQGLATGDVNRDAYSVRKFAELDVEFFCAQGFSKIFGMYNERIGNLTITVKNTDLIPIIRSRMAVLIHSMYLTPPSRSARIIAYICNNNALYNQWLNSIKEMASRMKRVRVQLKEVLDSMQTPGYWEHLVKQVGCYSYTGLTAKQVEYMMRKHHVYMLSSGRMCIGAIGTWNLYNVARAIHDVTINFSDTISN